MKEEGIAIISFAFREIGKILPQTKNINNSDF